MFGNQNKRKYEMIYVILDRQSSTWPEQADILVTGKAILEISQSSPKYRSTCKFNNNNILKCRNYKESKSCQQVCKVQKKLQLS